MKHLRLLSMVLIVLCVAALSGCGKKQDESSADPGVDTESSIQTPIEDANKPPEEGSSVKSNIGGVLLKDVLALWESGRKDEAISQFLSVQWNDPSAFRQIQSLTMSEKEFRSLSQSEMKQVVEEAMDLTARLRKLMFDVVSEGEKLATSGDMTAAKEHFMAVRRYGEALSGPERLEIIQMHGKAAIGYADKKLSAIK